MSEVSSLSVWRPSAGVTPLLRPGGVTRTLFMTLIGALIALGLSAGMIGIEAIAALFALGRAPRRR